MLSHLFQGIKGNDGTPIGFSEAVIESFVKETLTSAITTFASEGNFDL